jgi:hypothetical protein
LLQFVLFLKLEAKVEGSSDTEEVDARGMYHARVSSTTAQAPDERCCGQSCLQDADHQSHTHLEPFV